MFKKPLYKRMTELGNGGTRADDVKERPADNAAKPTDEALKRCCVEGLVRAAQLQSLLDRHGDQIPDSVHELAAACIEAAEGFNVVLERIGAEQPHIIKVESKFDARYDGELMGLPIPPAYVE